MFRSSKELTVGRVKASPRIRGREIGRQFDPEPWAIFNVADALSPPSGDTAHSRDCFCRSLCEYISKEELSAPEKRTRVVFSHLRAPLALGLCIYGMPRSRYGRQAWAAC